MKAFQLEHNCFCDLDSLCLNGVRFCELSFSDSRHYYILPENRDFTVHFHTDDSLTMSGFQILVTTSPLAEGKKVNQPAGRGNFPGTCSVATTYYPGIPYSDGCAQHLSGRTTTPSNYTDDNSEISNTTEELATSTDEQEYDFYYLSNSQQPTIEINTRRSPFLILSPNYGSGLYFDSQFSSSVLRSRAQPLVLNMGIKDFQVESHDTCGYDSVCVGGAIFCGDRLAGNRLQFIVPEYSDFTITLRTDGSAVKRGFKIEVSLELATRQLINQPRSGNVSNNGTFTYTAEKYRPGYPYSDRCPRPSSTTP
ncbi:hypothetical protein BsWGS_21947 [Bradybaena similaris]